LDQTAFYPTSGGQPNDTGTIAGVEVLDVYEENEIVVHVVDGLPEKTQDVLCEVDWDRRHDHMQQHTGQHILSQSLIQVCDIPTVGFTIGPDWSTIVLERKPDSEKLESALTLANTVIDENRRIDVLFPSPQEIQDLPVRGSLPEKDAIRIVSVDGFDWSPCGGTHCKTASDVRLILFLGIHKEKETYRLEFVCGRRASEAALQYANTVSDIASTLNVGAAEVVERTLALVEKVQSHESKIEELREARLTADKERLQASVRDDGTGIVAAVLEGRSIQEVRQLAHMLVEQPNTIALLIGTEQNKVAVAFARSNDRTEDMNSIMRRICEETGCRGGGNPSFASGGGSGVDAMEVLEAANSALKR
jgi:alanyl-tRNA synthetase